MKERSALLFPLGLMLLLAALSLWLDRAVQPAAPKRDGSTRHDPDYTVENFNATRLGADGTPRYVLAASRMVHYPDDDSTHLERPHFTRVEKQAAPLHILADSGLVSRDGKDIYFRGNVEVIREAYGAASRMTVNTEYLHVIPDKDVARTDKPVTIRNDRSHMTAVGLELDTRARIIKLFSRVKAHYEKAKR
jgi:lipopolysaccharide export system protein LptC